jgi:hypothetical protein
MPTTTASRHASIKPQFRAQNWRLILRDLRQAAKLTRACGSPKVAARIRAAVASAGGALRHAERAEIEALIEADERRRALA